MAIYHITSNEEWSNQILLGTYTPTNFLKDGFIHCSTKAQIQTVANRFYRGQSGLVILEINPSKLGQQVVYENLEGGSELFPHIYRQLPISAVEKVYTLFVKPDQSFDFMQVFQER